MLVNIPSCNTEKVRALADRFSLDLLTATVLSRRHVDRSEQMQYYLESDVLYHHSPFENEDVFAAVDRILGAIDEEERILIFGDRDVDGITSTAIMYKGLRDLGAKDVSYRLPENDDPYGLTESSVDWIIENGISLVITVDNGISAVDAIRRLGRNGIDTIVLDHHIPGEVLPPAFAIFDPKVEGSGYPFQHLAGCAVASKMIWALRFAKTELYGSDVIVLHAEPCNKSIRINAIRLENLIEIDRITEEVMEGMFSLEKSRLMDFLAVNKPIFVLDADTEKRMLQKAFGPRVDISLVDIRPNLEKAMPASRNMSLFDLSVRSRSARYSEGDREIETLLSLFRSISIHSYPSLSADYDDILQLAAIGTIADLMPMVDENRLIVKRGLQMLSRKPLDCLSYLFAKQNLLGKVLNSRDISFYVAPVLNAAGRMGQPYKALDLLLAESQDEIERATDELISLNKARQESEEDAIELVSEKAEKSLEQCSGKFILIDDERISRGLTGALASRFSKKHSVPCLVMASIDGGRVSASMRSPADFDSRCFLDAFSSFFDDFGGHRCAAGFSMDRERKEDLKRAMLSFIETYDGLERSSQSQDADAEIPSSYMTPSIWDLSQLLEPFGQDNEPLALYIRKCTIYDISPYRSDTRYMRFSIRYGSSIWPCIWWAPDKDRSMFKAGDDVSIIFNPEMNYWKGQGRRQLAIKAMDLADA